MSPRGPGRPASTPREAHEPKGARNLRVAHEVAPDEPVLQVLRAEERYPLVEADHVRVHPARVRVEGVGEAVAAEGLRAVLLLERAQRRERDLGREGERAGR